MKKKDNKETILFGTVSEVEHRYIEKVPLRDSPIIKSSSEGYELLINQNNIIKSIDYYESFYCIYLNRENRVKFISEISKGGISGTVCDPKIIFQRALTTNSSAIIIAHNHPSGNINPSEQDINITNKIKQGAEYLEITFLDHIIITKDKYFSFADESII